MELINKLFKGDKVVWVIFMLLCLTSIIEVFSAASALVYDSGDHWAPITQHCIYLLGGFLVVLLGQNAPMKVFKILSVFLLLFSGIFLIVVIVVGKMINGAARWYEILGIPFQPSEFAKMGLIIFTALMLSRMQDKEITALQAFKAIVGFSAAFLLLIAPENLSTALLLAGVIFLMMIVGKMPARLLLKLVGVFLGVGLLLVLILKLVPTEKFDDFGLHRLTTWHSRIDNFLEHKGEVPPDSIDINGKDAQMAHANIAIASSHIIGRGPGNSIERDFLPQAYSDFIYTIIIEEFGLVGGVAVMLLYVFLLIRAGKIARKCDKDFPALLAMGAALMIVSQAMLNMMVAVGLFPVTGQPLPLISKGGTSTFINCGYIAIILSVSRYANKKEAEMKAAENDSEAEKEAIAAAIDEEG